MSVDVLRYAAFTRDGRGGNPAGVVLDAAEMSETAMQAVAADVGYSETAFLLPGATLGIRYFSPRAEVSFCGHATVATAVAVAERDGAGELELRTGVGPVPVRTERGADGVLRATLTSVPTSTVPADPREVGATLAALRWAFSDLDPALPPHVSYAGAYHLVLATTSRARLAALDYDYPALERVMAATGWTTVHLVHRADATTFHVRNPFPPGGVLEDPATGAAAAAFGGYLRDTGQVASGRLTLWQGEDMGRPSELLVDVEPADRRVRVSGAAARIDGART